MKICRRHYVNESEGLMLVHSPAISHQENEDVYGVGICYEEREQLPEWAQSQMRLIEMFDAVDVSSDHAIPGVGHKGAIWYEFVGPKWEGEIEDVK